MVRSAFIGAIRPETQGPALAARVPMTAPKTLHEDVTGGAARTVPPARASAGLGQRLRESPGLTWKALDKFFGEGMPTHAAALSFSTVFSLPALLTLLLLLVGVVADPAAVQRGIVEETGGLIGRAGAEQVKDILEASARADVDVTLTAILGFVFLMFGATGAFASLQGALNKAWGVKPDPRRGQIRNFLVKRVFSFGVVVTVAFLLLVSLAVSAGLAALGTRLTARMGLPPAVPAVLESLVSFIVIAALFAGMFKLLPDARVEWRDVRAGALGSAFLFVLGKWVIGLYLGGADPGSAYGAAGSLAVVLIWVYYSSMLVLYGAMFTRVWAERYGKGVWPEKGAVAVVEVEKEVKKG